LGERHRGEASMALPQREEKDTDGDSRGGGRWHGVEGSGERGRKVEREATTGSTAQSGG
jgi:hypothetical protein